jgi:hypothetical protein
MFCANCLRFLSDLSLVRYERSAHINYCLAVLGFMKIGRWKIVLFFLP